MGESSQKSTFLIGCARQWWCTFTIQAIKQALDQTKSKHRTSDSYGLQFYHWKRICKMYFLTCLWYSKYEYLKVLKYFLINSQTHFSLNQIRLKLTIKSFIPYF